MIVGIQFHEDRNRVEFNLRPEGTGWEIAAIHNSPRYGIYTTNPTMTNGAGLRWMVQQQYNNAVIPSSEIRRQSHQCQLPEGWAIQCPHHEGPFNPPCRFLKRAGSRNRCVKIMASNFESTLEPIGQMSLFKPHVTHKRVWVNPAGKRIEGALKPFSVMETPCKERAVAVMELMKKSGNYDWVTDWKIRPFKDDPKWITQQQKKYAERFRNCIFDEY